MSEAFDTAHRHSIRNRAEIAASHLCGCFFCLATINAGEIAEWVDEDDGGETAICPRCGVDSVLGDASGFPLDTGFLSQMQRRWFGTG
ncbi:MAG: cytoplasmic protein [Pararhodobacter sp.]